MKIFKALFLLAFVGSGAQEMKLGKVSVAELSETRHPTDTSAAAAVIYKRGEVLIKPDPDGNWTSITEVEMRIKIYKKTGYQYANIEKEFYAGAKGDNLRFSDEATYNLENGKVVRTKMGKEGEFTEQKNKNWKSRKISLPNVKEGSIIEYKYTLTSYGVASLETFFFQHDIPVNFVSYRVEHPEYFTYRKIIGGFLRPIQEDNRINVMNGAYNLDRSTFTLWDVPAMKDEDYVDNINNYRSRMIYELNSYQSVKHIEHFASDWEAVTKKIYDNDDFGRQLERDSYFEEDIAPILAENQVAEEKMRAVFKFVQDRMNWNEYTGYSCNDGVRTAYKNKTGNVAEINLMLVAMLRHAKLKANPVLVSTRSNGIALFPSRTAFNYVVAAVETDMGTFLMDATSKNSQPNVIPVRAINWIGRIIRTDGTSAGIEMVPKVSSRDVVNVLADISPDGKVAGQLREQYSDHSAYVFRERYGGLTAESYLEKLEKRHNGIFLEDYNVENTRELDKPVTESYKFSHENLVEVLGEKMYFSPMLFLAVSENPFKQDLREFPVDFVFPRQDKYTFNINLPQGYVIESVPAPVAFALPGNIGLFKYNIAGKGTQIQLSVQYDINNAVIAAEDYGSLKAFFMEMIAKQAEKVVIKKV